VCWESTVLNEAMLVYFTADTVARKKWLKYQAVTVLARELRDQFNGVADIVLQGIKQGDKKCACYGNRC
jgi:hypothetical protein